MAKKAKTERTKIKDLPIPATQVTAEEASKIRGGMSIDEEGIKTDKCRRCGKRHSPACSSSTT